MLNENIVLKKEQVVQQVFFSKYFRRRLSIAIGFTVFSVCAGLLMCLSIWFGYKLKVVRRSYDQTFEYPVTYRRMIKDFVKEIINQEDDAREEEERSQEHRRTLGMRNETEQQLEHVHRSSPTAVNPWTHELDPGIPVATLVPSQFVEVAEADSTSESADSHTAIINTSRRILSSSSSKNNWCIIQ